MENKDFDFTGHVKHLEDAENVPMPTCEKTLTDSDLEDAGLVKTSAFVRTKKSKNALRIARHKKKKAQAGIKQLNVEVPEKSKEAFKVIAKKVTAGEISDARIEQLLDETKKDDESPGLNKKVAQIVSRGGLKAKILTLTIRILA